MHSSNICVLVRLYGESRWLTNVHHGGQPESIPQKVAELPACTWWRKCSMEDAMDVNSCAWSLWGVPRSRGCELSAMWKQLLGRSWENCPRKCFVMCCYLPLLSTIRHFRQMYISSHRPALRACRILNSENRTYTAVTQKQVGVQSFNNIFQV